MPDNARHALEQAKLRLETPSVVVVPASVYALVSAAAASRRTTATGFLLTLDEALKVYAPRLYAAQRSPRS
ncbi:MAG: hypothetical protein ABI835_20365 [Chloroflexota bacterium]